ncbi:MAG: esterase [Deltaproteobacteria bacterium]|nr:esterase [Deltaproteobacteria bacterium]
MRGTVEIIPFVSRILRNNPLGDPSTRPTPIYLPFSYLRAPRRRYQVVYFLPGYTGTGLACCNSGAWSPSLPERFDRLIGEGRMPEAICVMVDGFTAYGGSQYINSSATGRYMDYIARELVPWIDRHYRTNPHAMGRVVIGKSSGGFGALTIAMRRPGVFGAVGAHSSDIYFEYCFKTDFPRALRNLDRYRGSLPRFLQAWRSHPKRLGSDFSAAILAIAMASCYSPNRRAPLGFDLPFDPATGEMRAAVWRRWQAWDPFIAVKRYASPLRSLRSLYLDVGTRDEYHLQYGHRIFVRELKRLRIPHHYETFDDGHRDTSYRYDRSLPFLLRRLR